MTRFRPLTVSAVARPLKGTAHGGRHLNNGVRCRSWASASSRSPSPRPRPPFAQMRPDSSYWALVVPAHALTGIGLGIMFNSGSNTATPRSGDIGHRHRRSGLQHLPAAGRSHRHRADEHHRDLGDRRLAPQPPGGGRAVRRLRRGDGPRLQRRVLGLVGHLLVAAALAALLIRAPRPEGGQVMAGRLAFSSRTAPWSGR